MASIKQLAPSANDLLDEEALIKEARALSRRRRRRGLVAITLLAVASLIVIGVVHYTSSPTRTSNGRPDASAALTCPSARVKLLGVTAIPGGLGNGGVLLRASASSSATCTMSGYPIVGVQLTSHATAMASDVRNAYLGGFANADAPLLRLSITSRPRVVSFTIQMAGCNGPHPSANAIQITLPDSRETLTARSMYEGGIGVIRGFGIYCGHLQVTPLVKGSSGNGS